MKKVLVFGMTEMYGGVESFLMTYYRAISRERVQFDFLCNTETVAYEEEIRALGGEVFKICARSKNAARYRQELYSFFKARAQDYCAVWVNVCSLANIDYLKMAKKFGIGCRIIHSHNAQNMDSFARGLLHRLNRSFTERYATHFWACSSLAADWFFSKKLQCSDRFKIIPNAIDCSAFAFSKAARDEVRRELSVSDKLIIGNIGRLHRQKNQLFLLDIFKAILARRSDAYLLLVGGGEDEQKLRQRAKELKIEGNVSFLGVRTDIPRLLSAIDLFVFPSAFEGLGISLLEAQATGLPCFASADVIPAEAAATELVSFISLKKSATAWAEQILSRADAAERPDTHSQLAAAGFDICASVSSLQTFFENVSKYVLTEIPHNTINAGYKAKGDIRTVLKNEGFEAIDVTECFGFEKIPHFLRLIKKLKSLENGAEIVLQSPIYSFFNTKFMPILLSVLEKKAFKIILVVHDLESARFMRDEKSAELEKRLLSLCAKIIVHNESMKKHVCEKMSISASHLVELGIFDYLCPENKSKRDFTRTVCVAGNLDPDKSGYLYELKPSDAKLNVYGGNFDSGREHSFNYCGAFPPDELAGALSGSFGLVWDGDSTDTCEGVTGQYLKINNPHKASLYLAAGLPVIIWKEAALADYIERNSLGICVESLSELEEKLNAISEEKYGEMHQNAVRIGTLLRSGEFIRRAVKKAEEDLL